jgi:hypothetical protein
MGRPNLGEVGLKVGDLYEYHGLVRGRVGLDALLLQTQKAAGQAELGVMGRLVFLELQAKRLTVEPPGLLEVLEVELDSSEAM